MSKSIVKKALELIDDDDDKKTKFKDKLSSIKKRKKDKLIRHDRKQLARTCLTLKQISQPVVSSELIEQLNNYRYGVRDFDKKTKKSNEEEIFTDEDFKRFEKEYNPPLLRS